MFGDARPAGVDPDQVGWAERGTRSSRAALTSATVRPLSLRSESMTAGGAPALSRLPSCPQTRGGAGMRAWEGTDRRRMHAAWSGRVRGSDGGYGWTRTTDPSIMSAV